jgi:parallel beta-helix repeat protein
MNQKSAICRIIVICTVLSVFFVPVFAANDLLPGGHSGSIDPLSGQQGIIAPAEMPIPAVVIAPEETPVVTPGPTVIPTTTDVTVEPTAVPTTLPTTVVITDPTVIPITAEVTAEPTTVPATLPTIAAVTTPPILDNSTGVQGPVIPGTCSNSTIELNLSSSSQVGGFDLSWTANLTDPPLNNTNWQGADESHYWEINATTGSGIYPLDLFGLVTNSVFGIWIHDVTNVTLDGKGYTLQYNGLPNQGATGIVINGTSSETTPHNIQIVNLTLLGWDTGISIRNSENIYVMDNVTVTGNWNGGSGGTTGSGIVAVDSTNIFIASNLSAGFVTVQNNGYEGIVFDNVTGGLINNTYVINNRNGGINLTSTRGVTVQNVTATGNSQHGIILESSSNNNLTNNNASGNNCHGIYLESSSNNTLFNNTASGNKLSGIILNQNSNYNNLTNNNASGNTQYGIALSISSNNNLTNNTAQYNQYTGIYLSSSHDNNLNGNNASGSGTGHGFYIDYSDSNTLTGNNATGNLENGFEVINSTLNTLSTNNATDNQQNGFYLFNSSATNLTSNTAIRNTYDGFNLSDSNSNTLTGNNATDNVQNGFYLRYAYSNNLTGNNATGNTNDGFRLYYKSSDNNLTSNTATDNANGFYIYMSERNNLTNNNAKGNNFGFYFLTNSDSNILTSNKATDNQNNGFYLEGSSWNNLTGNNATSNGNAVAGYGFYLTDSGEESGGSNNNTLTDNIATNNGNEVVSGKDDGAAGFYLGDSNDNILINNTATENGHVMSGDSGVVAIVGGGFWLDGSSNNTLFSNNATGNYWDGFHLVYSSDNNNLTSNTATGNTFDGFYLGDSSWNNLTGNTARENGDNGFFLNAYEDISHDNTLTGNNATNNGNGEYVERDIGVAGFYLGGSCNNNLINNTATMNPVGFALSEYESKGGFAGSDSNTLTGNNATDNRIGILIAGSDSNNLTYNTISNNGLTPSAFQEGIFGSEFLSGGISLYDADNNIINHNWITGNSEYGISLDDSVNNTIYDNYFNNTQNAIVLIDTASPDSEPFGGPDGFAQNNWSIDPISGPNIVNGPYIGGNYWAQPDGQGWSQNHTDIGQGFTIPYDIAGDTEFYRFNYIGHNVDYHPLTLNSPVPTPVPPSPSGSYNVVIQPITPGTLPFDASFTGNNIPQNVQSCHSYNVSLTVKNTGTMNWSSASGVVLISSSSNGFTFDPSRYPIPVGVVVRPGGSYTFPVTINVPCPMNNGTYQLRFKMAHTVQTKDGPVEIPFGDSLTDSVTVGSSSASGVKGGVKAFTPYGTNTESSGQFTTGNPGKGFSGQTTATAPGNFTGMNGSGVTKIVTRNFNVITGLLWAGFLPAE